MIPANTWIQRKIRLSHSLMVGSSIVCSAAALLATAIGGITVRANQQWYVIVLCRVVYFENDGYLREKGIDIKVRKIWVSFEHQPVGAGLQWFTNQEERLDATILVGPCVAQFIPALIGVLCGQTNGDATGGRTTSHVEYVR